MTLRDLDAFSCPLDGIRFVEASAGTGKTWNIAALYLRMLLERSLDVRDVLVVTFTKAATAELRQRIRNRIVETLACLEGAPPAAGDPFVPTLLGALRARGLVDTSMRLRLDLALQSFDEASIFTIHGFCQRALADAPFASGMPLAVEVLPDPSHLLEQAVRDHWRRHLAVDALPPAFARHLADNPTAFDNQVKLLARRLARPLARLKWPLGLDAPPPLDEDPAQAQAALSQARDLWNADPQSVRDWYAQPNLRLNKKSYRDGCFGEWLSHWDAYAANGDALAVLPEKLHLLGPAEMEAKLTKGQSLPPILPFHTALQAFLEARHRIGQAVTLHYRRVQRDLLATAPQSVRATKQAMRAIGYDDMLSNLYERLVDGRHPSLATMLRRRFPVALVDEFQDTDPLQFEIFKAIHAPNREPGDAPPPGAAHSTDDPGSPAAPTLFLVGDPKQSIYGFRSADLHVYLRARAIADGHYTLRDNQRSTEPLIRAVNAVFRTNDRAFMQPGLQFVDARRGKRTIDPLQDDSGETRASLQLWEIPPGDDGMPLVKGAAKDRAIGGCAAEIVRLIEAGRDRRLLLGDRPLAAGDIAVLVRTHKEGIAVREALALRGVSSVERSQQNLFDSTDAQDVEHVLAATLEPSRDGQLHRALATDLIGWSATEVDALSATESGQVQALSQFQEYRDLWLHRGIGVMLKTLVARERVVERMLVRTDGERRLTNLSHLAECLHAAAEANPAPEALLRWLRARRADADAGAESETAVEAMQLRLESDRNLVQVVTVHASKGLEFPIVFCPTLFDGFPGSSGQPEWREYHDEDGTRVLDFRDDLDQAEEEAIDSTLARERAAEKLRSIYVALTRAMQRCYLTVGAYVSGRSDKESRRAALNWLVAGSGHDPTDWVAAGDPLVDVAGVRKAWAHLAHEHAGDIAIEPLPAAPVRRLAPQRPTAADIAALKPPARIPPAWRRGSYSGLVHGSRNELAAADRDLRVVRTAASLQRPPASLAPDDILRFPRGRLAGDCIHALFESIDFTDEATWASGIDQALRRHPQPAADPSLLPGMLRRMLGDVLQTPLPIGCRLADVGNARRFVELGFTLPSGALDAQRLAALLAGHGYPVPDLSFGTLHGYLNGFIDLVFEHGGRFHVLDWKSNTLGHTAADYGTTPLAEAMDREGYHLQYLFYALALHRYLQARLGARYDFDRHFGDVLYLFVRGVRPDWRGEDGAVAGVFHHRPSRALIESLSALLTPLGMAA
jgi:exodeoxyribonuclease V beta subunit